MKYCTTAQYLSSNEWMTLVRPFHLIISLVFIECICIRCSIGVHTLCHSMRAHIGVQYVEDHLAECVFRAFNALQVLNQFSIIGSSILRLVIIRSNHHVGNGRQLAPNPLHSPRQQQRSHDTSELSNIWTFPLPCHKYALQSAQRQSAHIVIIIHIRSSLRSIVMMIASRRIRIFLLLLLTAILMDQSIHQFHRFLRTVVRVVTPIVHHRFVL
mmetsp:Transcript_16379/g.25556  ORF Transcript_16379/g.25556 Transcript_16379/m.25556 type:complete len:213 (-) Transcript_16379:549-1187(-)